MLKLKIKALLVNEVGLKRMRKGGRVRTLACNSRVSTATAYGNSTLQKIWLLFAFRGSNRGMIGLIDSCFRRNDNREIYESGTGTGAWIQTFAGTELNCGGRCMPVNRISGMITRARLVRCTFCLKSISISSADSRFLLSQERQCRHVLVLYRQGRLSDHGHWMK